jgi:hypothetical protein
MLHSPICSAALAFGMGMLGCARSNSIRPILPNPMGHFHWCPPSLRALDSPVASFGTRFFYCIKLIWKLILIIFQGFHNMLIHKFDPLLSLQILGAYLDMMNVDGWIPRETAISSEAEVHFILFFVTCKLKIWRCEYFWKWTLKQKKMRW